MEVQDVKDLLSLVQDGVMSSEELSKIAWGIGRDREEALRLHNEVEIGAKVQLTGGRKVEFPYYWPKGIFLCPRPEVLADWLPAMVAHYRWDLVWSPEAMKGSWSGWPSADCQDTVYECYDKIDWEALPQWGDVGTVVGKLIWEGSIPRHEDGLRAYILDIGGIYLVMAYMIESYPSVTEV